MFIGTLYPAACPPKPEFLKAKGEARGAGDIASFCRKFNTTTYWSSAIIRETLALSKGGRVVAVI